MPNDRCAASRMLVMSSGGRKRLSIVSSRRPPVAADRVPWATVSAGMRLPHVVQPVDRRPFDRVRLARRPSNDRPLDARPGREPEVQAAAVLRAEAARRHDLLHLPASSPLQLDARADGAAVARATFELELNPMSIWSSAFPVHG